MKGREEEMYNQTTRSTSRETRTTVSNRIGDLGRFPRERERKRRGFSGERDWPKTCSQFQCGSCPWASTGNIRLKGKKKET